jgi:hypothetical protein
MSVRIFRVQDIEGRGPYKPGFSHLWTNAHHHERNPSIFEDFKISPVELKKFLFHSENAGCAFRSQQSLKDWFQLSERLRLEEMGYFIVSMLVDRIVLESDRQLIFARKRPLRLGCIKLPWHAEEWVG